MAVSFQALGDNALVIQFEQEISPGVHQQVRSWTKRLEQQPIPGVVEWVPTFTNVTIYYSPWLISYEGLRQRLKEWQKSMEIEPPSDKHIVSIPVVYGGRYGPDLEDVARFHNLSTEEVMKLHCSPTYLVYMIGFAPGFPYLGGMNRKLATPRLANPRKKVAQGSVGIADQQTGIYSISTPGGWRIIGRTPSLLFNPNHSPPSLLKAGDYVQFYPITEAEYRQNEGQNLFKEEYRQNEGQNLSKEEYT